MSPKEKTSTTGHRITSAIGIILCVVLVPILIVNLTLLAKSFVNKDEVPTVGKYMPLIVLSDSMAPEIDGGDLIICHTIDATEVKKGDIISFFDPDGNGTSVVTHRVVDIVNDGGELMFVTRGDANNTDDRSPVPADNVIGTYVRCISGAGKVAMFMQTTPGLMVCVVCPLMLLIAYDVIRRKQYDRSQKQDTQALLQELEALRAEKGEHTAPDEQ